MAEERKGTPVEKWDEVNGRAGAEEHALHDPTAEGSQMCTIEDAVEQNDNAIDGVINNLPKPEEAEKEEQAKVSVLKKLKEHVGGADEERTRPPKVCCYEPERE